MKLNRIVRALGLAGALLASAHAGAQDRVADWPSHTVRMIVPFAPGNVTDAMARVIAERLGKAWSSPVIVENRAGASAMIGMEALSRAAPDGYTLGVTGIGPLALNPALYSKVPYDSLRSFAPISLIYKGPLIVAVEPGSRFTTLRDLIDASRTDPRGIDFASPGAGSSQHLTAELLKRATGANLVHVPFKGSSQAATAVLGKQVSVLFDVVSVVTPFVRAGQLRPLAISSAERLPSLPNVPTMIEAGYPDLVVVGWLAVIAPADTPAAIRQEVSAQIARIMSAPEVVQLVAAQGAIATSSTPEEFGAFLKSEVTRWGEIVRATGVKLD